MPFKDPERRRAYGRAWMRRNADKASAAMRRWRASHREQHAQARDAWDAQHPVEAASRRARYLRAHPEVRRTRWSNRRARERAAEGQYTTEQWMALIARYDSCCAYCGRRAPLQPDHRVPLARGGTNWIDNILPACGPCNRRKHLLTETEFRALLSREPDANP